MGDEETKLRTKPVVKPIMRDLVGRYRDRARPLDDCIL